MTRGQGGRGWYDFAGAMLGLGGLFNGVEGLAVLFRKEYLAEADLLYQNLTFWGWVWLLVGVAQIVTAIALFNGQGRIPGMILAGVSALTAFISLGAAPVWGITIIAISVAAILGLARHGDPGPAPHEPSIPTPSERAREIPPSPR